MLQDAFSHRRRDQLQHLHLPRPPHVRTRQDVLPNPIRDVPILDLSADDAIFFAEALRTTSEVASSSGCYGLEGRADGGTANVTGYDADGSITSPFSALTCLDPSSIAVFLEDAPIPDPAIFSAYSSSTIPITPQLQALPVTSSTYLGAATASEPAETNQFDLPVSIPDVDRLLFGDGGLASTTTTKVLPPTPAVFRDECRMLPGYLAPEVLPDTSLRKASSCAGFTDTVTAAGLSMLFPNVGAATEGMFHSSASQLRQLIGATSAAMDLGEFNLRMADCGTMPIGGGGFYRDINYDSSIRRTYSSVDMQGIGDGRHHMEVGEGSCAGGSVTAEATSSTEEKIGRKISPEERKQKIHRYMKKRNERNFTKKIKYACRKTLADNRPRVRGRFARNDEFGEVAVRAQPSAQDEDEDLALKDEDILDSSDLFAQTNSFKWNYTLESWI